MRTGTCTSTIETAVYRTVRTVVWEDGGWTNLPPPTRFTFGESNKAYAPYPALITRTGRKDIGWSERSALWQGKALSTITAENSMQRILTRREAVWTWNTATKMLRTYITNYLMKHSPGTMRSRPEVTVGLTIITIKYCMESRKKTIPWNHCADRQ